MKNIYIKPPKRFNPNITKNVQVDKSIKSIDQNLTMKVENTTDVFVYNGVNHIGTIDTNISGYGGLLSGTIQPDTVYRVWGFLDTNSNIVEFGCIEKVLLTGITMPIPADYGAIGIVIQLSGTQGYLFNVGDRCIIRDGVTIPVIYNQCLVTNRTIDTITVTLDTNYTLSTNNNSDLSGATVEIENVTSLIPNIGSETSYDNNRPYIYIGTFQTGSGSRPMFCRKKGDFILTTNIAIQLYNNSAISVSTLETIGTGFLCLRNTHRVTVESVYTINVFTSGITAILFGYIDSYFDQLFSLGEKAVEVFNCTLDELNSSILANHIIVGSLTASSLIILIGWYEENY
jgi:hypothetical protein